MCDFNLSVVIMGFSQIEKNNHVAFTTALFSEIATIPGEESDFTQPLYSPFKILYLILSSLLLK